MSEKELDDILQEIKERSGEDSLKSEMTADEIVDELRPDVSAEAPEEAPDEETTVEEMESDEEPFEETPVETEILEQAADDTKKVVAEADAQEGAVDITKIAEEGEDYSAFPEDGYLPPAPHKKKSKRGIIIGILIGIIIIALGVAAYLYFSGKLDIPGVVENTTAATEAAVSENLANPITGEMGYNTDAIGKRPVAVVVENEYSTEAVRPQWAIADADMVMEGETEFSTRLLFFWADYTAVPKQVGPSRSARPPFIRFSQMWDSIFIHTGLSHSKDDYIGADKVFEDEKIDHVNLLSYAENGTYFGRDNARQTAIEHTGYLNGTNVEKLIKKEKIKTDLRDTRFTRFEFNEKAEPLSDKSGTKATFVWSKVCPKKGVFTYDASKGKYVTEDFDSKYGKSNVEFETLIYLLDETEYIVKENYKGSGQSETYCDYKFSGGKGKVLSEGTVVSISWKRENGKLVIEDENGNPVKLNPGKIYVGFGSSNNGGSIKVQ